MRVPAGSDHPGWPRAGEHQAGAALRGHAGWGVRLSQRDLRPERNARGGGERARDGGGAADRSERGGPQLHAHLPGRRHPPGQVLGGQRNHLSGLPRHRHQHHPRAHRGGLGCYGGAPRVPAAVPRIVRLALVRPGAVGPVQADRPGGGGHPRRRVRGRDQRGGARTQQLLPDLLHAVLSARPAACSTGVHLGQPGGGGGGRLGHRG
mmetsp:Transcript_23633/g.51591  ORF Transcript_23633/g.51591 Transcript_23633/m.51591 type:complete len:207 (-) Transcript_23633:73-693(-)